MPPPPGGATSDGHRRCPDGRQQRFLRPSLHPSTLRIHRLKKAHWHVARSGLQVGLGSDLLYGGIGCVALD